jgi:hypothetical protein
VTSQIYLPEGAEIRDPETGELIAVTNRDFMKFTAMKASHLDWVGDAPEPQSLIPRRFMRGILEARRKYMAETGDA